MSLIPIGVGLIQAGLQGLLQSAFLQTRSIGGFVANVTIEEHHTDEMRITDHPVERNAVISDHAFKLPMRVVIEVGYSNSSFQSGGDPTYVNDIYASFLELQESRELIFILTAKRLYLNMLIERLSTTTNEKTENSLLLRVECREVIIVDTQVSQYGAPQDQTSPGDTTGITNEGTVALKEAPSMNQTATDATFGNTGGEETSSFIPGNTSTGTLGDQKFNTGATTEIPVKNIVDVPVDQNTLIGGAASFSAG